MEVPLLAPVHRLYLPTVQIYSVLFFSTIVWIFATGSHHDGRTVDLMLARMGEGPLERALKQSVGGEAACEKGELVDDCSSLNKSTSGYDDVTDLCWGYEKSCKRENRLFVPQCKGLSKPWYVFYI